MRSNVYNKILPDLNLDSVYRLSIKQKMNIKKDFNEQVLESIIPPVTHWQIPGCPQTPTCRSFTGYALSLRLCQRNTLRLLRGWHCGRAGADLFQGDSISKRHQYLRLLTSAESFRCHSPYSRVSFVRGNLPIRAQCVSFSCPFTDTTPGKN